jgi:S-adenosylmethionine synthetase
MAELVREVFDKRPRAIIEQLDCCPDLQENRRYGHFGRELPEFSWERPTRRHPQQKPDCK